jgi:hypothetical protein
MDVGGDMRVCGTNKREKLERREVAIESIHDTESVRDQENT